MKTFVISRCFQEMIRLLFKLPRCGELAGSYRQYEQKLPAYAGGKQNIVVEYQLPPLLRKLHHVRACTINSDSHKDILLGELADRLFVNALPASVQAYCGPERRLRVCAGWRLVVERVSPEPPAYQVVIAQKALEDIEAFFGAGKPSMSAPSSTSHKKRADGKGPESFAV